MNKFSIDIAAVLLVLLSNTFGLAIHASSMPMAPHKIDGTNQTMGISIGCATLCRAAILNEKKVIPQAGAEDDDRYSPPHYAQFMTKIWGLSETTTQKYLADVKPLPKVPIYILYGVFRV